MKWDCPRIRLTSSGASIATVVISKVRPPLPSPGRDGGTGGRRPSVPIRDPPARIRSPATDRAWVPPSGPSRPRDYRTSPGGATGAERPAPAGTLSVPSGDLRFGHPLHADQVGGVAQRQTF